MSSGRGENPGSSRGDRNRRLFRLRESGTPESRRREELEEEIRIHLEMRTEELIERGWDPEAARAEAELRFGSVHAAQEDLARSARSRDRKLALTTALESLQNDVRLAFRRMRRAPGFTTISLLTLALGIGLTTSTFAAVDQMVLRELPYPEPDRLVTLHSVNESGTEFPWISLANWLDWVAEERSLEAIALFNSRRQPIADLPSGPVRPSTTVVSQGFFDVLRPSATAGRVFTADDVVRDERIAVVAESFWRDRMGAPPLPADLRIGGVTRQVVGVLSSRDTYPEGTDVWTAQLYQGNALGRNTIGFQSIARLDPGVSVDQARADLSRIADGIREAHPEGLYSWGVGVEPLHDFMVGDARTPLWILFGAAAAVLLIACLNLAGLSIARTVRRSGEIAVRVAIGAGRGRVIQEQLVEHLVLAVVGATLGLGVAAGAIVLLERRAASLFPLEEGLHLDPRVLLFAVGLSIAAALVSGLVPSLRAARTDPGRLSAGSRGGDEAARNRSGSFLVVAEVALALILLVGGALLVRSFQTLVARDLGFDPEGVLTAEVILDRPAYQLPWNAEADHPGAQARRAFWSTVTERVRTIPGVRAVGFSSALPTFVGGTGSIELDHPEAPENPGASYRAVGGDYFRALNIPLLAGRVFDSRDGPASERVTLVNRTMAERYWPGMDPIGRRFRAVSMEGWVGEAPWLTVVGVVGDVRQFGYDTEARPEMYVLAEQVPMRMGAMQLAVDAGDQVPGSLAGALQAAVGEGDPSIPVETFSLRQRVGDWVGERLFLTGVMTGLGAIALVLAGVGVYGLLAFLVAGRTREIGIRTALGAARGDIVRGVVIRSLRLSGIGIVVGLLGAYWAGSALETLLVETETVDPWSYGVGITVILFASVLAAWVPARRAARVDPVTALRAE